MKVIRKINNNVVMCEDDDGKQLIALGLGLGFCEIGEELDLSRIQRTFYDANPEGWTFLDELNQEMLSFASQATDIVSAWLPYQLSPNFAFILADHIAFAIKRSKEGLHVRMPLSYDVEQQYPEEYRIGKFICNRLAKLYGVKLPDNEVTGIALCFANNALATGGSYVTPEEPRGIEFDDLLERSCCIAEETTGVSIDRSAFNFSRFATHLQYLYNRIVEGVSLEPDGVDLYPAMREQCPDVAEAVDRIAGLFRDHLDVELTNEERFYLMLHVNRMCAKGRADAEGENAPAEGALEVGNVTDNVRGGDTPKD